MTEVPEKEFAALVAAAFDRIPDEVRAKLDQVALLVADEPTQHQLEEFGMEDGDTLFGLFEGLTRGQERSAGSYLPPTITIFRMPLLDWAMTREELEGEIADTLWHEVAHYLGYEEDAVRHEEDLSNEQRGRTAG